MNASCLISEAVSQHTGTMIALYLPEREARLIALPDGEQSSDLHCTLLYIKESTFEQILDVVQRVALIWATLVGKLGGVGRFNPSETSDGKYVIYATLDAPLLSTLREHLLAELMNAGINPSMKHGFTPHVTLKYTDDPLEINAIEVPDAEFNVFALSVVQGDFRRVDCVFGSRPIWPD